jgi:1,4-alpha-glucan branching enzyme
VKGKNIMSNPKNRQNSQGGDSIPRRFTVEVEFVFDRSEAKQVCICGDFNSWRPYGYRLIGYSGGELWKTRLKLQPGRYEYKFFVDGEWVHDPNASENVPNAFGTLNSVVSVGSKSTS